jgi:hypothetical protein
MGWRVDECVDMLLIVLLSCGVDDCSDCGEALMR